MDENATNRELRIVSCYDGGQQHLVMSWERQKAHTKKSFRSCLNVPISAAFGLEYLRRIAECFGMRPTIAERSSLLTNYSGPSAVTGNVGSGKNYLTSSPVGTRLNENQVKDN